MSNSSLISGTLLTNNCTKPRNHKIDRITPHFMEWYTSAKECCESFIPSSRRASANYCIGKDGEIWLNVEEKNRAWTSSSSYNDNRAITIECANYMDSKRYGVLPDATWDSLISLCVDICIRNGIAFINYTGDDSGNLTKHKWYAKTDCPGPWLDKQFGILAEEINKRLDGHKPDVPAVVGGTYICRVNGLRVRTKPTINSEVVAFYNMGSTVILDDWYKIADGYVWGRYTATVSKQQRYVAIGRDTGKVEMDDFLVKF